MSPTRAAVPSGEPEAPPSSRSTPSALASPPATDQVAEAGSGHFTVASGRSRPTGSGELVTYSVEVEEGLPFATSNVAREIDHVLGDRRGWTAIMSRTVQRVSKDATFRILLATPETTDALCAPLDTDGRLSCRNGQTVVLNAWRWANGATAYGDNLDGYRVYMVNHEFGHALGNGHVACPKAGSPAPVMVQQTKSLEGCTSNPWPTAG
ncbi:DUF3152 domain-containing protein [Nocardioides salarius]|uniref:DUF3152 domain-containing protein n=1 Tax=Nocardioides salarius TaxID=374513 RepID=UPI00187A2140|nr:DUF3152 domain-containing protein [Nocardioides salarius]